MYKKSNTLKVYADNKNCKMYNSMMCLTDRQINYIPFILLINNNTVYNIYIDFKSDN